VNIIGKNVNTKGDFVMKEYQKPLLYITVFNSGKEEVMLVSGNFTTKNFKIGASRSEIELNQL
jgi:hypothetical protein